MKIATIEIKGIKYIFYAAIAAPETEPAQIMVFRSGASYGFYLDEVRSKKYNVFHFYVSTLHLQPEWKKYSESYIDAVEKFDKLASLI